MSSPPFDATIDLALRPSLRALAFLFWLHTAILVLALVALPPGPPMAVLAIGAGASWFWTRRHRVFGHGRRALTRLTWHAGGSWTLHDAGGGTFEAQLHGSSLVHDALLVLVFRPSAGGIRVRALLGDETDPTSLRRLHARLRLAPLRAAR